MKKALFKLLAIVPLIFSSYAVDQKTFEKKAEPYLNGIKTLRANFVQHNPHGGTDSGRFYLSRGASAYGKLRLEYKPPSSLLIISDGDQLIQKDLKTQEEDSYPVSSTPAAFLLQSRISLTDDLRVIDFAENGNKIAISLVRRGDEDSFSLTLVFEQEPFLKLKEWVIQDGQSNRTHVKLSNVEIGIPLDPKLFKH